MSTGPLTEPEILELLTAELTPDAGSFAQWEKMYVGYDRAGFWCLRNGMQVECEEFRKGWVITSAPSKKPNPPICQGVGPTIPAAIADFRAKVAAEATALGAVKTNPTSSYNYLEAAIFAAFFQYAYTNSHTPSEAIDAANNAVEEYRATFK